MLDHEKLAREQGYRLVIGVDESGRGPLAGPVVASAVSLKSIRFKNQIKDSKKATARQREEAFEEICAKAHVGVGIVSETVIDRKNILRATYDAMAIAVIDLIAKLPHSQSRSKQFSKQVCLLIDGSGFESELPFAFKTVVQGDQYVKCISCASIVAKVTRDRILNIYDRVYPGYGFKHHKGYGTLKHRMAIQKLGPCEIHRQSFKCL